MAEREGRVELGHEEETKDMQRENSLEMSSEFSCASATDNIGSLGNMTCDMHAWETTTYTSFLLVKL